MMASCLLSALFKESRRVFEQTVGRLRAELAGDKEAALSAARRESDEELQVVPVEDITLCTGTEYVAVFTHKLLI